MIKRKRELHRRLDRQPGGAGATHQHTKRSSSSGDGSSLKTTVYERLRDDILYGVLRPGDLLIERKLAERFGVSKTPVREALMELRQEGLVEVIHRAGYFVSKVSVEDVQSIFHLRHLLETEAATLAASRARPDDLARLEQLVSGLSQALSAAAAEVEPSGSAVKNYRRLNRGFHVAVAEASQNRLLVEFVQRLMIAVERLLTHDLITSRGSDLNHLELEHAPILDAIRQRDPETATRLMAEHITRTKERILRTL